MKTVREARAMLESIKEGYAYYLAMIDARNYFNEKNSK